MGEEEEEAEAEIEVQAEIEPPPPPPPDPHVDALKARVAAGELREAALRLAAYLGDPVARRAVGMALVPAPETLYDWVYGLGAWGREASVRAGLAAARVCELVRREALGDSGRAKDVAAALAALEAWLATPAETAPLVARLVEEAWLDGREDWLTRTALVAATSALTAAGPSTGPTAAFSAAAARAAVAAVRVLPEVVVRQAVRGALVPWALGTR